ncbi:hypothetical protein ACSO1_35540 [Acinetobacter calcoaceticus]|nr:hypothetical protein ACSO1_35540 [Acinetobacter calcoaceticus]
MDVISQIAWHDFDKLKQEKSQPVQSLKLVAQESIYAEQEADTSK